MVNGSLFQGSKMKNFWTISFISLRTELFLSWKNLILQVTGLNIADSLSCLSAIYWMVHVALSLHPKQSMRLQLSYSENLSAVIKEEMLKDWIGRSRKHIWLKRLKWISHFNKEWNQGYMNGKKELPYVHSVDQSLK